MSSWGFRPYVSVAQRRANALKEMENLRKKGRPVSPVVIEGRKLAVSFWGKSWCDNLERYSDYENRLPRGRTYVNNGSVIDLQIDRGKIEALVSGSEIYKVKIEIAVAAQARWKSICADCAGSVASLVELLQGKLSSHVMERVCRAADGLFPSPKEIKMSCSCPDWAGMCKHVAATLYGVGARLDRDPGVLFALRGVEHSELISVGADLSFTEAAANNQRVLAEDDIAALFGLEIETAPSPRATAPTRSSKGASETPAPASTKVAPARSKAGVGAKAEAPSTQRGGAKARDDLRGTTSPSKKVVTNAKSAHAPDPVGKLRPAAPENASPRTTPAKSSRSVATPPSSTSVPKPVDRRLKAEAAGSKPAARATQESLGREKLAKGRTRAAKWIGAKARRAQREG